MVVEYLVTGNLPTRNGSYGLPKILRKSFPAPQDWIIPRSGEEILLGAGCHFTVCKIRHTLGERIVFVFRGGMTEAFAKLANQDGWETLPGRY